MRNINYELHKENIVLPLEWYDWYARELNEYYNVIKLKPTITQHLLEIGFDTQECDVDVCDDAAISVNHISMNDLELIWRGGE